MKKKVSTFRFLKSRPWTLENSLFTSNTKLYSGSSQNIIFIFLKIIFQEFNLLQIWYFRWPSFPLAAFYWISQTAIQSCITLKLLMDLSWIQILSLAQLFLWHYWYSSSLRFTNLLNACQKLRKLQTLSAKFSIWS